MQRNSICLVSVSKKKGFEQGGGGTAYEGKQNHIKNYNILKLWEN
jgi:hypothetical protein